MKPVARAATMIAASCALLAAGCSDPEEAPEAPETPFTMPTPREDAVARVEVGAEPESILAAGDEVPYIVHAACEGVESLTYVLYVDDEERSSRQFACGQDVRHTAFVGHGGETVRVELKDGGGEGTGFVEVVPHLEEP